MDSLEELSPRIRRCVRILQENGFTTCDSGDGSNYAAGMECALPVPMVAVRVDRESFFHAADHMLRALQANDMQPETLEASYSPLDGTYVIVATGEQLARDP